MDDQQSLTRIHTAHTAREIVEAVFAHYYDPDRAERTPRALMYQHIGQLCGWIMKLEERNERVSTPPAKKA